MKKIIKQAWRDPVWSNVIALFIVGIVSSRYISARSIIENISFRQSWSTAIAFLGKATPINNLIIILITVILVTLVTWIYHNKKRGQNSLSEHKMNSAEKIEMMDDSPEHHNSYSGSPVVFFADRVAMSFPGVRGFQWLNDQNDALNRLSVLLQGPLTFKSNAPIWWLRGLRNNSISSFKVLNNRKSPSLNSQSVF